MCCWFLQRNSCLNGQFLSNQSELKRAWAGTGCKQPCSAQPGKDQGHFWSPTLWLYIYIIAWKTDWCLKSTIVGMLVCAGSCVSLCVCVCVCVCAHACKCVYVLKMVSTDKILYLQILYLLLLLYHYEGRWSPNYKKEKENITRWNPSLQTNP